MRRRTLLLAAVLALAPAAARSEDVRDEVVRAIDAHPLRTDLVVLLDTSGSMARHFDAVRRFVGDLAALARPGDTITFIAFAERAGDLMPPSAIPTSGAGPLKARLAGMKPPRGRYTDLGAGLEATLDALVRPGYAPVSIVFLITDFCAEPPPGSAYAGELTGEGPCRQVVITEALRKRSKQVFAAGDQEVRAFALAIEPSNEPGYAAASEVLGQLVRVDVAAGDVSAALESLRARVTYDRAALAVEKMLRRPALKPALAGKLALQGARRLGLRVAPELPLAATLRLVSLRALDGSVVFDLETAEGRPRPLVPGQPFSGWAVVARNVPARAERWAPGASERAVEVEAAFELELQPGAPLEKLIGRTPKSAVSDRFTVRLPLELPDAGAELVKLAPEEERVELAPGATREVRFVLSSSVAWADLEARCTIDGEALAPAIITPSSPLIIPRKIGNDAAPNTWRLAVEESKRVVVSAECALAALGGGQSLALGKRTLSAGTSIVWREGAPPLLLFGAVFGLAALGFAYLREVRPRLAPAALTGRLVIYDGPGDFRRVTVPLRGRARVELDGVPPAEGAAVRVEGDRIVLPGPAGTRAALYAEKSGKRSVMRLSRLAGEGVALADAELGPAPVVLRRGRARFSVGEYHCRID